MKTETFPLYKIAACDLSGDNSDSELKIPNIQRGLVWKAQQMELLWDSILREFPIGSMLAQKNEGHYDILDGQQRANAIITGFNVSNILEEEKPLTSILWIDLSFDPAESDAEFRKYGIRLTNSSHPWGFEKDGGKLSAGKRREALRAAYGDVYPESKKQWDIRRFVPFAFTEKESFLPVPLAFLVNAAKDKSIKESKDIEKFWSEFTESVKLFSKLSEPWERRYQSGVNDFIAENRGNKDFMEPFFKLNEYKVIFNYVDEANETEVLFNRINRQGTAISNSELAYSAIKHYGADICGCPEIGKVIKKEADGLMLEQNLAQILFRYCFSLQRIRGEIDAKTVRKYKRLIDLDEFKEDEKRVVSELKACFGADGYLHKLLDESRKILLSSPDGCPLPSFLYAEIADKNPELILLLLKLTHRHKDKLEDASPGFIQALVFYLYCFSVVKTPADSIFKAANDPNFSRETAVNILRDAISREWCLPLVASFRDFPALDEKALSSSWARTRYSDCRGYLAFRRLFDYGTSQGLFMLKFAQRHYYQKYFGDYNPSVRELWNEINRPWDHDHIIPRNWTAESEWKEVHSAWINSIGNIADIPFEQNRGKSDDANWDYYLAVTKDLQDDNLLYFDKSITELDDKALRKGIESEMMKFISLTKDRFLKITDGFLRIFAVLELDKGLSPMQQERKDFILSLRSKGYMPYYLEQSGKEYLIEDPDDNYCWQRPWVSAIVETGEDSLWRKAITIYLNCEESSFLVERGFRKRPSLDLSATDNRWWEPGTCMSWWIESLIKDGRFSDNVNLFVFGADIFNADGLTGFIADSSGFIAYEDEIDGHRIHAHIFEYYKYFYCSIKTSDGMPLPDSILALFSTERHWRRIGGNREIESERWWRVENIRKNCDKFRSLMIELHSLKGISSGFYSLDGIIGGFRAPQLTVIASRPAVGKTAFALNIARHVAVESNIPTAFFSLEKSSVSVVKRLMTAVSNMDWDTCAAELRNGEEGGSCHSEMEKLQKAPLWIDDTSSLNVTEFRKRAETIVNEKGVRLMIVDYLQLMNGPEEARGNQKQETASVIQSLRQTAQDLNVPIIALSMLKRKIFGGHKKPEVSDLPYAVIGDKADVIMLIDCQGDNVYDSDIRTVSVAKNANGPTGDVRLAYSAESFNYTEIETE